MILALIILFVVLALIVAYPFLLYWSGSRHDKRNEWHKAITREDDFLKKYL